MDLKQAAKMARKIVDRSLKESTRKGYLRSFHQLDDRGLTPQAYANEKSSAKPLSKRRYYALKAGYQYGLAEQIIQRFENVKALRRIADEGALEQAEHLESMILDSARLLEDQAPDYGRQRKREGRPSAHPKVQVDKKSRKGKRQYLGRLNKAIPDWQMELFRAVPRQHRLLILVLAASGCRPAELYPGREVGKGLVSDGVHLIIHDKKLVLTFYGAKTGQGYGQMKRELVICPVSTMEHGLYRLVEKAGGALCCEPAASDRAVRGAVELAVIKALGKRWKGKVSMASFRHQFSADLKGAGVSKEQIAIAMGHCSDRTQGNYGLASQRRKGSRRGLVQVTGSQPVKRRDLKPSSNVYPR
ncbi:site-specific integrase [Pseudodesulfovibrio sp. JC047]|uniref:site-specific integrase n=1 Tax=Pseudodesulfovibrio sp. JC047 TaxID=2683199 RepID=UPI0013D2DB78|nr:site-specific integrase [Pseudodesulfovibrio sp. JC047]